MQGKRRTVVVVGPMRRPLCALRFPRANDDAVAAWVQAQDARPTDEMRGDRRRTVWVRLLPDIARPGVAGSLPATARHSTALGAPMRRALSFAFMCALVPLPSCGAIMASGTFLVPIDSHPCGATVFHEGRFVGITPCEAPVTVGSRHLELLLDGFHPQLVDIGTERNEWAAANALSLGLGLVVDVALGAHRVPDTARVIVHLRRSDAPSPIPWTRAPAPTPEPPPPITGPGHVIGGLLRMLVHHVDDGQRRR